MITSADLSPVGNSGSTLVDAIWAAYREDRRDLHEAIATLLSHDDPIVREEAIGLLFVKWTDRRHRAHLVAALREDGDFGVRGRAAFALACISEPVTRHEDIALLLSLLRDGFEHPQSRRAAYEGLLFLAGRRDFPARAPQFNPDRDVDWGWVSEFETREL